MVASERPLRLRRRAGCGAGAGAGAVARWRDSRATVDVLVDSTEGLDLVRFLTDTGAFIKSLLPCSQLGMFSAEILQDFAVDVQQRLICVKWLWKTFSA
jgi:hypothetical protein